MDSLNEQPKQKQLTRRNFLKGLTGLGLSLGLGRALAQTPETSTKIPNFTPLPIQSEAPIPEVITEQGATIYHDLTPGIGIGVAWVGSGSTWNPIVENIIKATT
ncbi:MAG TPA: twin-arginine translocation signal domain-containing protein, partial [Candidatus Woesebacteria bacterium]|nr:twin-arginine translocation signal domain-containing protein [Candidatus Woesebacteria bacterium]